MRVAVKVALVSYFLGLVLGGGCRRADDRSPVIGVVNGQEIHRAQFDRFLALKMGEFNSADLTDSLRSQLLDEFIRRRIVLGEAARAGLSVTDAEIGLAAQDNPQIRSTAATADKRQ